MLTPSPQSGPSPKAPAALGQLSSSLWQHPAQWDALKAWGCILFWDAAKGLTIPQLKSIPGKEGPAVVPFVIVLFLKLSSGRQETQHTQSI